MVKVLFIFMLANGHMWPWFLPNANFTSKAACEQYAAEYKKIGDKLVADPRKPVMKSFQAACVTKEEFQSAMAMIKSFNAALPPPPKEEMAYNG